MIETIDLGIMHYRDAWTTQEARHERVLAGAPECIFLVEHPPVITQGRRPLESSHLLASQEQLSASGVDFVESDRGGDITFHGPGQIVVYPIIRLVDHGLTVSGYVRALEQSAIDTLAHFGVIARREEGAVGVWAYRQGELAKVCAIGVRIRKGVSLHGLALNVDTDLHYFDLIIPCGLTGRAVTSMRQLLGSSAPSIEQVKDVIVQMLLKSLSFPVAKAAAE